MGYILISVVIAIISMVVSNRLKSKFKKYSRMGISSNLTGKEVAEKMLRENHISDVRVTCVQGQLTDHYNPINKTVNLSPEVYQRASIASAAIAAHECGHAIQHAQEYSFLKLRSTLVPVQNVSSQILSFVMLIAFIGGGFLYSSFPYQSVLMIIIVCYSVITLFSLVTLPVEIDASNRALAWLKDARLVSNPEFPYAKDALKWAGYTYLVAALGSVVMLLYFILQFVNSRD